MRPPKCCSSRDAMAASSRARALASDSGRLRLLVSTKQVDPGASRAAAIRSGSGAVTTSTPCTAWDPVGSSSRTSRRRPVLWCESRIAWRAPATRRGVAASNMPLSHSYVSVKRSHPPGTSSQVCHSAHPLQRRQPSPPSYVRSAIGPTSVLPSPLTRSRRHNLVFLLVRVTYLPSSGVTAEGRSGGGSRSRSSGPRRAYQRRRDQQPRSHC